MSMRNHIKRYTIKALILALVWVSGARASASVTVAVNLGANWVGTPTDMTASQPSVNFNSAENNWGGSAPYSLGQSFTATVSGVLTNIQMYFEGNSTTNVLSLYDMGPAIQYLGSQPSPMIPGSNGVSGNLLSANLSVYVTNMSNPSVIQLSFSGADAVQITGGHEYLFDVSPVTGSQQYWFRDGGGTDIYGGGAAYRQNSFLNGSTSYDFSLAVTLVNTSAPPTIYDCVVDWNNVHQRIDGFGASSAWQSTWTTNEADMFFSTNSGTGTSIDGTSNFAFNGIGLSFLRSRIVPGGTTVENSIMQMAQARGARVWSTPWSPAAQFKDNDNVDGGNFLSASNQAYANQLAGYVVSMKQTYGVNIYAISVQNEPDVSADYESCIWTAAQIDQFVPYLAGALAASNAASTKIIVPEDEHWETNDYATTMMDPTASTNVSIVACHDYSGTPPDDIPAALPLYDNTNAAEWETETAELMGAGQFNGSIADAMYWAGRIQLFLAGANANAWHYWWLISANPDNEGLTDTNGIPAKRMYVLGQYSRFVRPNNYRIDLANYNSYAVLGTAYKDPVSGNFAIVMVNTNAAATEQSFYFTNFTATTVTPWITSTNFSLAAQTPVSITNSTFSYLIPGMSVVTFAGTTLTNETVSPILTPIANQTVNPGATLSVTNTAVDANVPPLNLTFTLLNGPTNATLTALNATNALFSWTPLPGQANTTNLITIEVADNGTPSLSATNSFYVIVNTEPNPPPSTNLFTFTLLNGPAGSSLNSSNGVFTWRPPVGLAGTTNLVTVAVTENFAPNLSATNSYQVIINPLTPSVISAITGSGGQFSLTVNGTPGPDYTLLASTNLVSWQPLFTSNSPALPLTLTVPVSATNPAQFYRIQIGP